MRNIKKLLALMLVMVMALGMVPMVALSAPADFNVDDFIDADSIDERYVEAVDVLAALSVYIGEGAVGSRSFNPKGTFTRGQAAAIMARIILGSTTALNLPLIDTGYSDVPAGHWAAGYVSYGKEREIILGYGDGTFGVDDPVTGLQMARLLLRAIGYGTEGELEGPGWEVRTVERATSRDVRVLWGTGEIDFSAPATREQVAQYTFNALTNTRTVTWNTILNTYTTWSTGVFAPTDERDRLPTLGTKTFGLVNAPNEVDAYGYDVHVWKLNSINNANSLTENYRSDVTLATSTNGTALTTANNTGLTQPGSPNFRARLQSYLIGLDSAPTTVPVVYYVNGTNLFNNIVYTGGGVNWEYTKFDGTIVSDTAANDTAAIVAAQAAAVADANDIAVRRGAIVNLVDRNFDGHADKVVIILKTASRMTADPVVNAVSGAVTLNGVTAPSGSSVFAMRPTPRLVYPSDLKSRDVVLYHTNGWGITIVEHAESADGQMTQYSNTTRLVAFGGSPYAFSGLDTSRVPFAYQSFTNDNNNYNEDATAYFDDNGSVVAIILGAPPALRYLVVTEFGSGALLNRANVIFADGTRKTIDVVSLDGGTTALTGTTGAAFQTAVGNYSTGGKAAGRIWTYTENDDGTYNLSRTDSSPLVDTEGNTFADTDNRRIYQKAYFLTESHGSGTDTVDYAFVGNDNTIFITEFNEIVRSYTGVVNVPLFTNALNKITIATRNGVAAMVYIEGEPRGSGDNWVFFVNFDHFEKYVGSGGVGMVRAWVIDTAAGADGSANPNMKQVSLTEVAWNKIVANKSPLVSVTYNAAGAINDIIAANYNGTKIDPIGDGPSPIRGANIPSPVGNTVQLPILMTESGVDMEAIQTWYRFNAATKIYTVTQTGATADWDSDVVALTTGTVLQNNACDFYVQLVNVNDNLISVLYVVHNTNSVTELATKTSLNSFTHSRASTTTRTARQNAILTAIGFDADVGGMMSEVTSAVTAEWTWTPALPADINTDTAIRAYAYTAVVRYGGQSIIVEGVLNITA